MSDKERALLVRIKGLLLLAVDLIDRECRLGKYAVSVTLTVNPGDSMAGVIPDDKLLSV